jgi:hypothetical protein
VGTEREKQFHGTMVGMAALALLAALVATFIALSVGANLRGLLNDSSVPQGTAGSIGLVDRDGAE